jgi:hypothetical protein
MPPLLPSNKITDRFREPTHPYFNKARVASYVAISADRWQQMLKTKAIAQTDALSEFKKNPVLYDHEEVIGRCLDAFVDKQGRVVAQVELFKNSVSPSVEKAMLRVHKMIDAHELNGASIGGPGYKNADGSTTMFLNELSLCMEGFDAGAVQTEEFVDSRLSKKSIKPAVSRNRVIASYLPVRKRMSTETPAAAAVTTTTPTPAAAPPVNGIKDFIDKLLGDVKEENFKAAHLFTDEEYAKMEPSKAAKAKEQAERAARADYLEAKNRNQYSANQLQRLEGLDKHFKFAEQKPILDSLATMATEPDLSVEWNIVETLASKLEAAEAALADKTTKLTAFENKQKTATDYIIKESQRHPTLRGTVFRDLASIMVDGKTETPAPATPAPAPATSSTVVADKKTGFAAKYGNSASTQLPAMQTQTPATASVPLEQPKTLEVDTRMSANKRSADDGDEDLSQRTRRRFQEQFPHLYAQ